MEKLFKTIFEAFPEKSMIVFKAKCSDCSDGIVIHVIPTSEGFGLLGGAFVECLSGKYAAKCPDCYKVNSKMVEYYRANPDILPIFGKKEILSSIW
ncbi:MAG: hypothetical protein P8012_10965 [Desulfobacterales bacterium]